MKILIIGGSGFLSGTLTRMAVAAEHQVTVVTRGQKPLPEPVAAICADRKDRANFEQAIGAEIGDWDLVVDCIGMETADAEQDVEVFAGRAGAFVFISTDFVYHPAHRIIPQREDHAIYLADGYGGRKRQCEEHFIETSVGALPWTILRPCHIYGPGSLLGCLPLHGRDKDLVTRLRKREALRLVGGGAFLQQPVFAADIADAILAVPDHADTVTGQIFNIAGPDIVHSREYYQIVADILGEALDIIEEPVEKHLSEKPDSAPFCCDRVYDLGKLHRSGLPLPATSLRNGLAQHVASLK